MSTSNTLDGMEIERIYYTAWDEQEALAARWLGKPWPGDDKFPADPFLICDRVELIGAEDHFEGLRAILKLRWKERPRWAKRSNP